MQLEWCHLFGIYLPNASAPFLPSFKYCLFWVAVWQASGKIKALGVLAAHTSDVSMPLFLLGAAPSPLLRPADSYRGFKTPSQLALLFATVSLCVYVHMKLITLCFHPWSEYWGCIPPERHLVISHHFCSLSKVSVCEAALIPLTVNIPHLWEHILTPTSAFGVGYELNPWVTVTFPRSLCRQTWCQSPVFIFMTIFAYARHCLQCLGCSNYISKP